MKYLIYKLMFYHNDKYKFIFLNRFPWINTNQIESEIFLVGVTIYLWANELFI